MELNLIKQYVDELLGGSTRIAAFCKVFDCARCHLTSRLYDRVHRFHESLEVSGVLDLKRNELTLNYNLNIRNIK